MAGRLEAARATVATNVTRYDVTVEGERWEEEVLHSTTAGGVRYVYDLSGDARRTGQEGGDPQCTIATARNIARDAAITVSSMQQDGYYYGQGVRGVY